jgi:hypothetical protein
MTRSRIDESEEEQELEEQAQEHKQDQFLNADGASSGELCCIVQMRIMQMLGCCVSASSYNCCVQEKNSRQQPGVKKKKTKIVSSDEILGDTESEAEHMTVSEESAESGDNLSRDNLPQHEHEEPDINQFNSSNDSTVSFGEQLSAYYYNFSYSNVSQLSPETTMKLGDTSNRASVKSKVHLLYCSSCGLTSSITERSAGVHSFLNGEAKDKASLKEIVFCTPDVDVSI